jgi:hypothetical protein
VKRTLVQEVITTPVVTAAEAMPFRDLAALLYAEDIGAVPVVAPTGQVLGVVDIGPGRMQVRGSTPGQSRTGSRGRGRGRRAGRL